MMEGDIGDYGEVVEEQAQIPANPIPLFIKKLWKMVNDKDAENIIGWSETGDSFIIHDQLQFITKLLPRYFKHNNLASFVRQLNFYNFHKVPNVRDEFRFSHTCFMKDLPEILPFIRRKNPVLKQKSVTNLKEQEVEDLLNDIKNLKGKHSVVDKELATLKQENGALWSELNSLRLKYTKQSTIINMLIHFLITYIHSHQNAYAKPNIQVSRGESSRNNIKVGPQLLEIAYNNNKRLINKDRTEPYSVIQPGTSSSITYVENKKPRKNHSLQEMLAMDDQTYPGISRPKKRPVTYSIKLPGNQTEQLSKPEIQNTLLEILKENQRLCEEDTDQMVTELEAAAEADLEVEEPMMEDITETETEDTPSYTVSYPTEHGVPTIQNPDYPDYVVVQELLPTQNIKQEAVEVNPTENVVTEIPIATKNGIKTLKISHPQVFAPAEKEVTNNKKLTQPSKVVKTKSSKPKFIKIPTKNVKQTPVNKNIKTGLINVSSARSPRQASVKQSFAQNLKSPKSINPEGALLEILKENEKLNKANAAPDMPDVSSISPAANLLGNPAYDQSFGALYEDLTDDPSVGISSEASANVDSPPVSAQEKNKRNNGKSFSILANPKEELSTFVDNTQEEIDMLQDILNNLTNTDLSEILNSDPPTAGMNLENDTMGHEGPLDEFVDVNDSDSVNKYFKNNFLDLENE